MKPMTFFLQFCVERMRRLDEPTRLLLVRPPRAQMGRMLDPVLVVLFK